MQKYVSALFALLLAVLLPLAPARAAPSAPALPDPALWMADGPVHASVQIGSTLYIGGAFSTIRPRTGGGGVLDPGGAVDTAMPPVHGEVRTAAPDGAGGWYIGGLFDSVGGLPRSNLAHIRADKSVDPDWAPTTNATVH